jgi:RNA-directed DNA polymerase
MREPHGEGVATHSGPESCGVVRKGGTEALTGVRTGQALSREIWETLWGADAVERSGRPRPVRRYRQTQRDPARSKNPSMCGTAPRGKREIPCPFGNRGVPDRIGKSKDARR